MVEDMGRMQRNMDLFFDPYMLAIARYEPDFAALKAASCRIVSAVGDESRGELTHDGGLGLADELGTEASVFPGARFRKPSSGIRGEAQRGIARLNEPR